MENDPTSDERYLLEQYKLYVEMADRVSERRGKTNQLYIGVLSGLIALLSFLSGCTYFKGYFIQIVPFVSIFGIILCLVWMLNIASYRQLNTAKFQIIHRMEEQLPFACYKNEWELLGNGTNFWKYLQLTKVEKYVPVVLAFPFILFLIVSIALMVKVTL